MQILFTTLALVILSGCVVCAVIAYRNACECSEIEDALRRHVGRIAANELGLDALTNQHRKLAGRFYASLEGAAPKGDPDTPDPQDGLSDRERLRKEHSARMIPPGTNHG